MPIALGRLEERVEEGEHGPLTVISFEGAKPLQDLYEVVTAIWNLQQLKDERLQKVIGEPRLYVDKDKKEGDKRVD